MGTVRLRDLTILFAPVPRKVTVRTIIETFDKMRYRRNFLGVKNAFPNANFEEEIYVIQRHGFQIEENEDWVNKLWKALYEIKRLLHLWIPSIGEFLQSLGFI